MRKTTLQHGGLTLAALTGGTPDDPAIVLLHGWPQSKEVYEPVIDALAEEHFVLAFDLPDIGESRGAAPSAEKHALADVILSAAEHAGAKSIVVAGFDVGGMIAFAAARDHGDRLSGAVVANTVIPGIEPWSKVLADPHIWHFAFHSIPKLPELLVAGHQRAYFDFFTEALAANKPAVSEKYRSTFARAYARDEALSAGFEWYRAMQADAVRNGTPKPVDTPMLYVRGDADGRSPDDYLPGLEQAGVRHVEGRTLAGSGELAPLEATQEFIDILADFSQAAQTR